MAYVPLERLIENNASIFRLVLAAAERANQLLKGAEPLVTSHAKSYATVALEEFIAGKVSYEQTAEVVREEAPEKEKE